MKKNCNGCKAFERKCGSKITGLGGGSCQLGFNLKDIYNIKTGAFIESKPLEDCPKPKTLADYVFQSNKKIN